MPTYSSVLPMTGEQRLIIEKVKQIKAQPGDQWDTHYMIEAHDPENGHVHWQLETLSPWRASLCERHIKDGQPLLVIWRRTAYGKDLVEVSE